MSVHAAPTNHERHDVASPDVASPNVASLGTAPVGDLARLATVRERMVGVDDATRIAELFRLLGDPTRTRILYALLEAGELCVSDLATVVEAPETSVSHALRLLRTAGIVRNRRDGRLVHYSLDDGHVRLLLDLFREHVGHGPGAGHP